LVIGAFALAAYGIGHYREHLLDLEVAKVNDRAAAANKNAMAAALNSSKFLLEAQAIEKDNLTLRLGVENERQKRIQAEKALQEFKTLTQLSEEALAGSRISYIQLEKLSRKTSDLSKRASERVKYVVRDLAYYEQPPGIVLALDLSTEVNGKKVRILDYPTGILFNFLRDESIANTTRFSILNDICQKPVKEVDQYALELLRTSQYLPAVAATTTILRRLHNNAVPFMDTNGWIAYLVAGNHTPSS
jgi:hypothetical protein